LLAVWCITKQPRFCGGARRKGNIRFRRPGHHRLRQEGLILKRKILIVEDEPSIVDNIQYALETDGFEVVCFPSGLPVLSFLSNESADLIVLDIGLPDINGLELCKEIRKSHAVPIIFLTARTGEIDRVVGLEIGADDYIIKPFSPRELSARVKAVLRRTPPAAPGAKRGESSSPQPGSVKAFQVNDLKRQISYFGKGLELSRYEFDILKTFIKRPGHVYSRDQLMDLVWEQPDTSLDRTVDAHIKNIRAKLRAIKPEKDPIVTHRGTGYSLKEDV